MPDRLFLLVEGPDDRFVMEEIKKRHGLSMEIRVHPAGGYESLRNEVSVRLRPLTEHERFGIIIDADSNLTSRWESIAEVLRNAGYVPPASPEAQGIILEQELMPRVGVWVMPDNTSPGILEDFLSHLVPEGDSLIGRARQVVGEIPESERLFSPVATTKAIIHTWLAWRKEPGTPLGLAITRRYLATDTPRAADFLTWLRRLFA